MSIFSFVIGAQIALVVVGIVFQVAAFLTTRKDWIDAPVIPASEPEEEKAPAKKQPVRAPDLTGSTVPRRPERDYYEMEDVPSDVRPADMFRTAKIHYVQSFKMPRS